MRARPDILLVDWLGRGGIAHTTLAWHEELRRLGHRPLVMTRGGRELGELVPEAATVSSRLGPVAEHARLVGAVVRRLAEDRPAWVVLSGSVLPHLEIGVVLAAKACRAKVCFVAHESSSPNALPLAHGALRALWRLSDVVVVHSAFIRQQVSAAEPRGRIQQVPHPSTRCLASQMEGEASLITPDTRPTVLTFGQLQKSYKGADSVSRLADAASDKWRFVLVGSGIPDGLSPLLEQHRGFFPIGRLAATVAAADVVLLPYRRASQSGAVVLSQWLGTPVISTDVGGISEQIENGRTGLLVPAAGDIEALLAALDTLTDPIARAEVSSQAAAHIDREHQGFIDCLRGLFGE